MLKLPIQPKDYNQERLCWRLRPEVIKQIKYSYKLFMRFEILHVRPVKWFPVFDVAASTDNEKHLLSPTM